VFYRWYFQFFFIIHLFERFNEDPSVLDDLYLDHSKILFNTALRGKLVFSSYTVWILRVLYHHLIKQHQTQQLVTTTHSNMFVSLPKFNTTPVFFPSQGVHVSHSGAPKGIPKGFNFTTKRFLRNFKVKV